MLDKAHIRSGVPAHADKAYSSQKHRDALKACGIKNGIQDKATRNNPLTRRQLQRNCLITKSRYVVERAFDSQARWFNGNAALLRAGLSTCLAPVIGYGIQLEKTDQTRCRPSNGYANIKILRPLEQKSPVGCNNS